MMDVNTDEISSNLQKQINDTKIEDISEEKTDDIKKNYKGPRLSCLKKLSDHNKVLTDFNMPEYRKYFEQNLNKKFYCNKY